MNTLINEFKAEHQALAAAFQEIKDLGIVTTEAKKLLSESRHVLLDHLQKEDEYLYPIMHKQAEQDSKLAAILKIFGKDMEDLAVKVMAFFDKYEQSDHESDFPKDFAQIIAALGSRIDKEETILFKEFEQITERK